MGDRRPSRWQDEDSESEHEKIIHIQCWIPGEGIDLTVLASYLKEYIDDTADYPAVAQPSGNTYCHMPLAGLTVCRTVIRQALQSARRPP